MSSKQGRVLVVSLMAAVLWGTPALASSCDEVYAECMYRASLERDERARDYLENECYANYDSCVSQPVVCGDGLCSGDESCANCTQDCGTGNGSYDLGTVKRDCSSTVLGTQVDSFGAYNIGGWCYYPVYYYVSTTCSVYRRTQIDTCGNPPYVQETYEGTSTEYGWQYAYTYQEYGACRYF